MPPTVWIMPKMGWIEFAGLIAYDLYCFRKLFFAIVMILCNIKTQMFPNRKLQNIPRTAQPPKLSPIHRCSMKILSSLFATSVHARFLQEFTQISPIGFDAIGGGCLGWHVHGFGHGLLLIRTSAVKQKARGSGSFRSVVGRMGKMEDHNEPLRKGAWYLIVLTRWRTGGFTFFDPRWGRLEEDCLPIDKYVRILYIYAVTTI